MGTLLSNGLPWLASLGGWLAGGIVNALGERLIGPAACARCGWVWRPGWPALYAHLRLRGRCPSCCQRLPWRPLLSELALAGLWALTAARLGFTIQGAVTALYLAILVLISVVDLATRRIPNVVVLPATALALFLAAAGVGPRWPAALAGGAVGAGFFGVVYLLGVAFLRRLGTRAAGHGPALGLGDVKLALFIGLAVGYPAIVAALLAGTLAGAAGAIVVIIRQLVERRYQPLAAMAYGPCLALGAAIALLTRG